MLVGYDGACFVRPGTGNQIVSSEGPTMFCYAYKHALAAWRMATRTLTPRLTLQAPNGGKKTDGTLQVFADDVFSRRLVKDGKASTAKNIIQEDGEKFDETMLESGFAQNVDKRVVVPELSSVKESRMLQTELKGGRVEACTRHLGGLYNRTGCNRHEIKERIAAMTAAWAELGAQARRSVPP